MNFSENEKAIYLFCAPLPQTKTKPLTTIEWNVTVKSLAKKNLAPAFLFECTSNELIQLLHETGEATESQKSKITEKVEARQKLAFSLSELEDLNHKGFGVLFRANYPKRLKKLKLKQRPPFYYFIGDISILNSSRTLSVVGSRDATEDELQTVAQITAEAARNNVTIVSGGARGVDSIAVDTALEHGGKAIIFPTEGLAVWARKKEYRKYIQTNQLLLLSVQHVEAKFTAAYAMQRNKFIHSVGDATLVASSQISKQKKSGTWEGVMENLKEKWSPIFVIGESEGVKKLIEMNAAKPFTSFNDAFLQNKETVQRSLHKHFKHLVLEASQLGLSKEEIKQAFHDAYHFAFQQSLAKEKTTKYNLTEDDDHFTLNSLTLTQTDEEFDHERAPDTEAKQLKWDI